MSIPALVCLLTFMEMIEMGGGRSHGHGVGNIFDGARKPSRCEGSSEHGDRLVWQRRGAGCIPAMILALRGGYETEMSLEQLREEDEDFQESTQEDEKDEEEDDEQEEEPQNERRKGRKRVEDKGKDKDKDDEENENGNSDGTGSSGDYGSSSAAEEEDEEDDLADTSGFSDSKMTKTLRRKTPHEAIKRLDPNAPETLWSEDPTFMPHNTSSGQTASPGEGPRGGDLVVPDATTCVEDAIIAAKASGQRVFLREGSHFWKGYAGVDGRSVKVTGNQNARLIGAWYLKQDSAGSFLGISLALRAQPRSGGRGHLSSDPNACIMGLGGAWAFDDCEIRAVMCTVIR